MVQNGDNKEREKKPSSENNRKTNREKKTEQETQTMCVMYLNK